MTVRYECDGPTCDKVLSRDEYRLGLNEYLPSADTAVPVEEIESVKFDIIGDETFHWCSTGCLIEWAINKSDEQRPT